MYSFFRKNPCCINTKLHTFAVLIFHSPFSLWIPTVLSPILAPIQSVFKLVEMIEILVSTCPIESFKLNFYWSWYLSIPSQAICCNILFHILSSGIFLVSSLFSLQEAAQQYTRYSDIQIFRYNRECCGLNTATPNSVFKFCLLVMQLQTRDLYQINTYCICIFYIL